MRVTVMLFTLSGSLLWAGAVCADPPAARAPTLAVDRRAVGIWLGPSALGGLAGDRDVGAELGVLFETRVSPSGRVRVALARSTYTFQDEQWDGTSVRDDVALRNAAMTLLLVRPPRSRITGYAGAGLGVSRYTYRRARRDAPWQGSIHALAGLERGRSSRLVVTGEVRIEAANGPQQSPLTAVMVIRTQAAVGMKLRF